MTKVGVGIITYNRRADAMRTYEAVRTMTVPPCEIVVADDGSRDGTADAFRSLGVPCVTGRNRNVAWNKNRALFYLREVAQCEVLLLLEDDCFPHTGAWIDPWIAPTLAFGHINLLSAGVGPYIIQPVPDYPGLFATSMISAQCASFSRTGLDEVGYFDPRFTGHGYEHVEHTKRFLRAGMGGLSAQGDGRDHFYSVQSDLTLLQGETFSTAAAMSRNETVYNAVQDEPVYRAPWRTDEDREELEAEVARAVDVTRP